MISQQRERQIAWVIVGAYVLLALAFSLGPIFEGPDEIEHYRFIRSLAHTLSLPDPRSQVRAQYHQAPLYYALAAPFALLIDDSDFTQIDGRLNPYYPYELGVPGNDNKNLYLHTRAEDFPYTRSGTARAVHLIRLLSIGLGAGTVLVGYAIFRLLWPDRPDRRLMALGVVAFTPQFLYLTSTINNDNLLYLLTAAALFLLLRQRRDGPSRRGALQLGVVLGAALLTKVNAAFLVFPVGLTVLMDRRTWRFVPLILGMILLIAGWWYARNVTLYGEPTGVSVLLETWKTETIRPGVIALDIGLTRVPYGYQTYWARFGQGAVPVAQPIYVFFDLLTIIAFVGVLVFGLKSIRARSAVTRCADQILIVVVFGLAWVTALVYYASTAWSGNQGRYLLPALTAWGALIALGLDQFTPRRFRLPAALGGLVALATVAAISVFGYFLLAYRAWSVPAADSAMRPLSLRFGDAAELIGVSPGSPRARPGDLIRVSLYWRAIRPTSTSLQTYLHSVESDVVKRDSLPGTGNLLSTDWQPGETWAEHYVIAIPPGAREQAVYTLLAGLYDPAAGSALTAVDGSGAAVTPVIGRIAINGPAQPPIPIAYRFGGSVGLSEPRLSRTGDRIEICLRWQALAAVSEDYTVFVHVLAADESRAGQKDFQPIDGRYPTGAWSAGELIDDCVTVDAPGLPQTGWRVALGLYNPADNRRLPVRNVTGQSLPDDMIVLEGQ